MSSSISFSEYMANFRKKYPGIGRVPEGWIAAGYEDELLSEEEYCGDTLVLPPIDMTNVSGQSSSAVDSKP